MPQAEPAPLLLHAPENALSRALIDLAQQAGFALQRTDHPPESPHIGLMGEAHPLALTLPLPQQANSFLLALQELHQRMAARLRLPGGEALHLYPPALHLNGRQEALTTREAQLLHSLLTDGSLSHRSELLHRLWGYHATVETRTLETHLYRLRKKIKQIGGKTEILLEGGRLSLK